MCKSNRPFIPANDYSEFIIVHWNEWPVGIAHNYTALFRSILGVLSPLFSSRFPTYRLVIMLINLPISHVCLSPVSIQAI